MVTQSIRVTKSTGDRVNEVEIVASSGRKTILAFIYDSAGALSNLTVQGASLSMDGLIDLINGLNIVKPTTKIEQILEVKNASMSHNLVKNGDFEMGDLTYWNSVLLATVDSAYPYLGKFCVRIPPNGRLSQNILPVLGINFRLQFSAKHVSTNFNLKVSLIYNDGVGESFDFPLTDVWTYISVLGTRNMPLVAFSIRNDAGVGNQDAYVDDIYGAVIETLPVIPKAFGQTSIVKRNEAVNGTAIVYTVTAGKVFYLTGGFVGVLGNVAGLALQSGRIRVDTAGDGIYRDLAVIVLSTSATTDIMYSSCPINSSVPLGFAAGTVFQVSSSSPNIVTDGCVYGWEENA